MAVVPERTSASACLRSAARCRYVKSTWSRRSIAHSTGCGSFTFTTSSACSKTSFAERAMRAPAAS
jgi:hypothetical protein